MWKKVRMESWKQLAAGALIVLSFWNVFYPEFTLTGDAYQSVEDTGAKPGEEQLREDYYEILEADRGEVEIRLSFLENKKGKRAPLSGQPVDQADRTGRGRS